MAEGAGGEKTEKATPKRRQDAREKGQVLKSMEVVASVSLLVVFAALKLLTGYIGNKGGSLLSMYLSGIVLPADGVITIGDVTPVLTRAVVNYLLMAIPILLVAMLAGVLTNVMQFGLLFSTKALTPKFSKLNPLEGFKRIFSSRTVIELVKSIIKIVCIIWIMVGEYEKYFPTFSSMCTSSMPTAITQLTDMIFSVAFKLCALLCAVAAFDFMYQYWKFEKDLMMSKYEIKMEYKQQEGDPQIKGKIKQKQREMASMRMMQSVPDADVVITNPTHFAVALKYDQDGDGAPIVIAKGQDNVALKIKEIAREAKIEIVEDKPLARAIYANCELGMEIPPELYAAVAEVLAYVYKLKKKAGYQK